MIHLTRLNGGGMYLNADLVALVEAHHDTVVTLVDGKTYVVLETAEQVVDAVRDYRASILVAAEQLAATDTPDHSGRLVVLRGDKDHTPQDLGAHELGAALPDGGR